MSDLFSIRGRTAVITGGSSGIGRMIAEGYVRAGARVIISSRKADVCAAVVAELNGLGEEGLGEEGLGEEGLGGDGAGGDGAGGDGAGTCQAVPADLSSEGGCAHLAAEVAKRVERVDILVNNAGATWGAPLETFDDAAWDRALDLNVKGVFHTTKYLLPLLRASGSAEDPARIINIGSIDGIHVPQIETYSYSASKAAVHQLTRHLAKRLAPVITVNAIAPGPFESKMMQARLRSFGEEIAAHAPLRRIGRADDMAGTAIFLASRAGAYLTGAIIPVDGGIATVGQ